MEPAAFIGKMCEPILVRFLLACGTIMGVFQPISNSLKQKSYSMERNIFLMVF